MSFFLFGPRSTGKTTLLSSLFSHDTAIFDLLDSNTLDQFRDSPAAFRQALEALPDDVTRVIVDEVQKAPALLDVVQTFIQKKRFLFGLTGSSARKLKRGHANLLGGRAVTRSLWPLTSFEIESYPFDLMKRLHWGTLPDVVLAKDDAERSDLLRTYVKTYLAEEIVAEQLVRNLTPFRKFLGVAAQMNGKIINALKIGNDVGTSHNTVSSYFEILEETLIGFSVPAYDSSVRKRVRSKRKFYLFDPGVCRAIARSLEFPLQPGTSYYGDVFEHYVICEIHRLASYLKPDWELFYFQTTAGSEIDVVIDKGQGAPLLIEIKSTTDVTKISIADEIALMTDFKGSKGYVLSQDPIAKVLTKDVKAMPWLEGLREIFF